MALIMVVDDDIEVLQSIAEVLEEEYHDVIQVSSGFNALELMKHDVPDLLLLDIMMPEMDGIEVCRHIRADPFLARLPIIFLTAKNLSVNIAQGLDAGADDYLIKPFDIIELPARIRAVLRRSDGNTLNSNTSHLIVGPVELSLTRFEVTSYGDVIHLTSTEYHMLHCLMTHPGQLVTIDQLLEDVLDNPQGVGDPQSVRVHISNLRNKLNVENNEAGFIKNVRGRGYVMVI